MSESYENNDRKILKPDTEKHDNLNGTDPKKTNPNGKGIMGELPTINGEPTTHHGVIRGQLETVIEDHDPQILNQINDYMERTGSHLGSVITSQGNCLD
jgi:hypothetical protein